MPYSNEFANKVAHVDIIRNPEVSDFLSKCEYLTTPSDEEAKALVARFEVPPAGHSGLLPEQVIAVDGSYYESSIDDRLPSTKVGYVKIGSVLVSMSEFGSLRVMGGRFVDPFRVAQLQDNNSPLTFPVPSANIRMKGQGSVRDSFRLVVDEHLYGPRTRFVEDDPSTSLRTTLFYLASRRPGAMGTGDPTRLKIHKCPTCGNGPVEVRDIPDPQYCSCGAPVYPSDCLRLWEEVTDFQSNITALSRFMLQVEHLLPFHYIRYLSDNSLAALGATAFIVDGPLAMFGNGAWLHRSFMEYLHEVNTRLKASNLPQVLLIGLQKTGQVADHVRLIDRFIEPNRLFAIDDDYRYRWILSGRDPSSSGFGYETYYGQDFIFKTPSGRSFILGLPYPFPNKDDTVVSFVSAKTEIGRYPDLARALTLVTHFECDLYENALVPVALAHRYTAISLVPGGRVLDLLTRQGLKRG